MAEQTGDVFWAHLEELRKRLIFCILTVSVLAVACYFFSSEILSFLTRPLSSISQKAYFLSPYDAFVVKLQISFWTAVFLASPLLLTEVWLFIAPGLYEKEKRFFSIFLLTSIVLFLIGLSLGVFFVVPATLNFFLAFSTPELQPLISIDKYLSMVAWMALAFGLASETPIFLVGLVRFKVLSLDQLKSMRKYVIVGIFVFAAVVTPSPDPFSQCLLAIPLWLLFELSLIATRFLERSKLR